VGKATPGEMGVGLFNKGSDSSSNTSNTVTTNNTTAIPTTSHAEALKPGSGGSKKNLLNNFMSVFGGKDSAPSQPAVSKLAISQPFNPVHLTHVGYNSDTGEFVVWSILFYLQKNNSRDTFE
jgi:p21-activated kinase 1